MNDAWDEMKQAKEDEYFYRQEKEALARLNAKKNAEKAKLSPIDGKPLTQLNVGGVIIDKCESTGGVWLDAGELEQLLSHAQNESSGSVWTKRFISNLFGSKK